MIAASRLLYLLQRETEFPSVDWMLIIDVELASETPTVDPNLEFSVVIYFEMFRVISSSDKLPRPSMSRHREVGIWRTQIKVKVDILCFVMCC